MYKLADSNIEARPIWKPMHMQPIFEDCDFITAGEEAFDEKIFAKGLCLPSDIKMTEAEQQKVIDLIKSLI
jgi:pyridoxal phosphate-dependent aminotransferase EpsN